MSGGEYQATQVPKAANAAAAQPNQVRFWVSASISERLSVAQHQGTKMIEPSKVRAMRGPNQTEMMRQRRLTAQTNRSLRPLEKCPWSRSADGSARRIV